MLLHNVVCDLDAVYYSCSPESCIVHSIEMEGEENKFAKITNDIIVKSIAAASGVADNNIQLVGHEESEGSVHGVENFTGKLTAIAATAKVDGAVREFFFMAKCVQMEEFHVGTEFILLAP